MKQPTQRSLFPFSATVLGLVLAGCGSLAATASPPMPATASAEETAPAEENGAVELHVGESAELAGLRVTFVRVDGDNRCPPDVQCIVAGQADVVLEVADGEATEEVHAAVPPGNGVEVEAAGRTLRVTLAPEPSAGTRIEASDYVLTLIASEERAASAA